MFFEKCIKKFSTLGTIGVSQRVIFGSGSPKSTKISQKLASTKKHKNQQSASRGARNGAGGVQNAFRKSLDVFWKISQKLCNFGYGWGTTESQFWKWEAQCYQKRTKLVKKLTLKSVKYSNLAVWWGSEWIWRKFWIFFKHSSIEYCWNTAESYFWQWNPNTTKNS